MPLPDNRISIIIQADDFSPAEEQEKLSLDPQAGAVITFTGLVRNQNREQPVYGLFLEHYPGMTEKMLDKIAREAIQRWSLQQVRIIHRIGQLNVGDRIVYVGVSASHRHEGFQACEFIMDYLKTQAPFWKKERSSQGDSWLEQREIDQEAAHRWNPSNSSHHE
ncbi:Molybdopterin synthase catalytic subunit [invertebrate metagenome]|uniref:Molybdopterin synthase catalytic subunit n=1 Tax=invertebrate metagenome TaxID=1711999 RepID=A0A2H9TCB3_9ZZZZ